MRKITITDHLRYRFDNLMSRGSGALIAALALTSIALIFCVSLFVILTDSAPAQEGEVLGFADLLWMSFLRALDPGTIGGDHGSVLFLSAMMFITISGIFVFSTLIGILTTGFSTKLAELRKGRSFVCETEHTVILGWSSQIFPIISELVVANENRRKACIAILAEKDKVEMEDEIRAQIGDSLNTKIVCRTGSPTNTQDLEIVHPEAARSLLVLSSESHTNPDIEVIKTILAVTNSAHRKKGKYHLVAQILDPKYFDAAKMVGRDEVELILAGDVMSRIAVQTCRQSGLSTVYQELLDFAGDEIYFQEEPELIHQSYADALFAYEDSAVIGIRKDSGEILLNPSVETKIERGDKIIAITEDNDTLVISAKKDHQIQEHLIRDNLVQTSSPERTLILGWNERVPLVIKELDQYVSSGSEVLVVADHLGAQTALNEVTQEVKHLSISFLFGNSTNRDVLNELVVHSFHHVLVMSSSPLGSRETADSQTLLTLLHLRQIAEEHGHRYSIVSEMLDVRNRELAQVTQADDFIVSHKLISLMMSQISENKELNLVFKELFRSEGSEIYLKPVTSYIDLSEPVNFYTIVESAKRKGESAIGYRRQTEAHNPDLDYGVVVNPLKSEKIRYEDGDKILVLAES